MGMEVLSLTSAADIRRTLADSICQGLTHEHASPAIVEPSGNAIQSVTTCIATPKTFRRIDEMEKMLEGFHHLLVMDVTTHFVKDGDTLVFGQLTATETFETNASALRMQGTVVETLSGQDPDTRFVLHRTNKVICKPCKHLLGRCAGEELAVTAVTPENRTFIDWLNTLFVR